jgi:hypothetical protein
MSGIHSMAKNVFLTFAGFLMTTLSLAAALPDLVQLKMAAEAGDPVAQFQYGQRVNDRKEKKAWYLASAQQGYAPAQDAVAAIYAGTFTSNQKEKKALNRDAVRWASRAAYQGNVPSQLKLSGYYEGGTGVAKDPVAAYMWAQISVDASGGDTGLMKGIVYRNNRDKLVKRTSTEDILEGQKRAAGFQPRRFTGLNPVEADLVFGELKLSAIYIIRDHQSAVVNNVRFFVGETKDVKLDDESYALTCQDIQAKSATLSLAGTDYEVTLQLKR